ncbi:hypothetical protein AVEN_109103-1 [Araneus ventricosus]|uniref:Uncharacterized protein n=1 Tax=Araneus ventricosus TaxID=182803 RepID=A0A4Y2SLN9_ARAVE|nr:hypothetical protein AVEN_109103-1 [Araneus ventricosus]
MHQAHKHSSSLLESGFEPRTFWLQSRDQPLVPATAAPLNRCTGATKFSGASSFTKVTIRSGYRSCDSGVILFQKISDPQYEIPYDSV